MFTLSAPSSSSLVALPRRRGGGERGDTTTSRSHQSSGRRRRRRRVASSRGDFVVKAMAKKGSKSSNDEPEGFGFPRYLRLPPHSRTRALSANFPQERERGFLSLFLSRARSYRVRTRVRDFNALVRSFTIIFSSVIRRFVLVSLILSFFSLRALILSFSSFSLSRSTQRRRLLQQRSRPGLGAAPDGNARAT